MTAIQSRNVRLAAEAHDAFNRRDFDRMTELLAPDCVFHDRARSLDMRGREEILDWMRGWATAFPDARVTEERDIDGGDTVVSEFVGRGRNDGELLPGVPPTGKEMSVPFCEILRFDDAGQVVEEEIFYDQMSLLGQLGLAPQPS